MPHLQNSLCITDLPNVIEWNRADTARALNKFFEISHEKIKIVHLPQPNSKSSFCFIQFHHYSHVVQVLDQIEKLEKDGRFRVFQPYQIVDWFRNSQAPENLEEPFAVIKEAIILPNATKSDCYNQALALVKMCCIQQQDDAKNKIYDSQQSIHVDLQPFTDKLILSQDMSVKIVSRDAATQQFNINEVILQPEPQSINSNITFRISRSNLKFLLDRLPWNEILTKREPIYFGVLNQFFKGLMARKEKQGHFLFKVQLYSAKFALESLVHHVKCRQHQIQKVLQQFVCFVEAPVNYKPQIAYSDLPNVEASLGDFDVMISILADLQEQQFARTRSDLSISEVKNLCQQVSMPQSKLNQVGAILGNVVQTPSKSLNYLIPQKVICDQTLISQNSPFILLGNLQRGSITICSSLLQATPLLTCQFFSTDIDKKYENYLESLQKFKSKTKEQIKIQTSINKKQVAQPWFTELGADAIHGKLANDSVKKVKKDSKKIAKKSVEHHHEQIPILQQVDDGSFNIIAREIDETTQVQHKPIKIVKTEAIKVQIVGFFLITKEHGQCMDPLLVGMIYSYEGKFFLKIRKIMYLISFLMNFVKDNYQTGNQVNLIDKVQVFQGKNDLQSVLKHMSCFIDQYPLFIRNQNILKHFPQRDPSYYLFTEVQGCEIELTGVTKIVDYTKVQYSILSSNQVVLLVETSDGKQEVREYAFQQKDAISKIEINLKALRTVTGFRKVFLVESNVVLCSEQRVTILDAESLDTKTDKKLKDAVNVQDFTIINQTPKQNFLNAENLERLGNNLPQQNWVVCSRQTNGGKVFTLPVVYENTVNEGIKLDLDIKMNHQDLKGIQNLLSTKKSQDLVFRNETMQSSESGFVFLNVDGLTEVEFELKTQNDFSHVTIDLEVNLRVPETIPVNPPLQDQIGPLKVFQSVKQIPLQMVNSDKHIRHIIGKEQLLPSTMVCPDQNVYTSNYSEPEFIFQSASPIMLTSVQIWSKISRESLFGYPVGEGLVYASANLEDLQCTQTMNKNEFVKWAKQRSGPILPHEPILYFDMKSEQKITVPVRARNVQFFKFVPTQLRRCPINYADSKQFKKCKLELQFFGVEGTPMQPEQKRKTFCEQISQSVKITVNSGISEVTTTNLCSVQNISTGFSLINPHTIFNAKLTQIPPLSGTIQDLNVPLAKQEGWQKIKISAEGISKLTIHPHSYIPPLLSSKLAPFKDILRETLLFKDCSMILKPVIDQLYQNDSVEVKREALNCLEFLQKQVPIDLQESLRKFLIENIRAIKILDKQFACLPDLLQKRLINFLNQYGGLQSPDVDRFVIAVVQDLNFSDCRFSRIQPYTLKNVLVLVSSKIQKQVTELLEYKMATELRQESLAERGYFYLRAKLHINTFPFDIPIFAPLARSQAPLPCEFNYTRINTFVSVKVCLQKKCFVQEMRLLVRQDASKVHRMRVTVLNPKNQIISQQNFDQSYFNYVAEKMHKQAVVDHFCNVNQDTNEFMFKLKDDSKLCMFDRANEQAAESVQVLNQVPLPMSAVGQNFEIQIELLDTYRSVHKGMISSQVLITPEVFGYALEQEGEQEPRSVPAHSNLCCNGKVRIGGIQYKVFKLPTLVNDYIFEMTQALSGEASQDFDQRLRKVFTTLAEKQKELQTFVASADPSEEKQLIKMIGQVNKLKLEIRDLYSDNHIIPELEGGSNLQYSLSIGKVVAHHLHSSIKEKTGYVSRVRELYTTILKCFIIADCGNEEEVLPVLKEMFDVIPDEQKVEFQVSLIDEFLINPLESQNMKAFFTFIKSEQLPKLQMNSLLAQFLKLFNGNPDCQTPKISTQQEANQLLQKSQKRSEIGSNMTANKAIAALNFLKEYSNHYKSDSPVNVNYLFRIVADHLINCYSLHSGQHSQKANAFNQLACDLACQMSPYCNFNLELCEGDVLVVILNTVQSESEAAQLNLTTALSKIKTPRLESLFQYIFGWMQDHEKVLSLKVYKNAEKSGEGAGFQMLFTHLNNLYQMFAKITTNQSALQAAHLQLTLFIQKALFELEKSCDDLKVIYMLIQIFQNLPYLNDLATQDSVLKTIQIRYRNLVSLDKHTVNESIVARVELMFAQKQVTLALHLLGDFLTTNKFDSNVVEVCDRILSILLTGNSLQKLPKRQMKDKNPKIIKSNFDESQFRLLLQVTCKFMIKRCNYHNLKRVSIARTKDTIQNLVLLNKLMQLLYYSPVLESFDCNHSTEYVTQMLTFVILNSGREKLLNLVHNKKQCQVLTKVKKVIEQLGSTNSTACLNVLITSQRETDQQLLNLTKKKQISDIRALEVSNISNRIFTKYLDKWLAKSEVAVQFASSLGGFDFLISRLKNQEQNRYQRGQTAIDEIGSSEENQSEEDEMSLEVLQFLESTTGLKLIKNRSSLYQTVKKRDNELLKDARQQKTILKRQHAVTPMSSNTIIGKKQMTKKNDLLSNALNDGALQVVDFNKDIKLIDCSEGKQQVSNCNSILWNTISLGYTGLASFNVTLESHFKYQYYLVFDLGSRVQLDETIIKFVYSPQIIDRTSKELRRVSVYPEEIILEGLDVEPKEGGVTKWRVLLNKIHKSQDIETVVFGADHQTQISPETVTGDSLCSIGRKEARYIRLILKNPKVQLSETPTQNFYDIFSISVTGIKQRDVQETLAELKIMQRDTAIKSIHTLFQSFFKAEVDKSAIESIAQKFIENFNHFAFNVGTTSLIKTIYTNLAKNSDTFCEWLIMQLLSDEKTLVSSFTQRTSEVNVCIPLELRKSFLEEILSCNQQLRSERLMTVLSYIKSAAYQMTFFPNSGAKGELKFLTGFIKAFMSNATNLSKQTSRESAIQLKVTSDEIETLITLSKFASRHSERRAIGALVVFLMFPPAPFQNELPDVDSFIQQKLLNHAQDTSWIISLIFIKTAIQLPNDYISFLIEQIQATQFESLRSLFNIVTHHSFKDKSSVVESLYQKSIQVCESKSTGCMQITLLKYLVQTILSVIQSSSEPRPLQLYVVQSLEQDLNQSKRKYSQTFIKQFALPILEACETIDICISTKVQEQIMPFYTVNSDFRSEFQIKIETDLLSTEDKKCLSKQFELLLKSRSINSNEFQVDKWDCAVQFQQKQIKDKSAGEQICKKLQGYQNLLMIAHCLFQSECFTLAAFTFSNMPKSAYSELNPINIGYSKNDFGFITSEKCGPSIVNLNLDTPFIKMNAQQGYSYDKMLYAWFGSVQLGGDLQGYDDSTMSIKDLKFQSSKAKKYITDLQNQMDEGSLGHYSIYKLEIWGTKPSRLQKPAISGRSMAKKLSMYQQLGARSYFEQNLVFQVPTQMQVQQLRERLCINDKLVFEGVQSENVTIKSICSDGNLILTQTSQSATEDSANQCTGKNLVIIQLSQMNSNLDSNQKNPPTNLVLNEVEPFASIFNTLFKQLPDDAYLTLFSAAQNELLTYQNKDLQDMYQDFLQTIIGLTKMMPCEFLNCFLSPENEDIVKMIIKHDSSDKISSEDLKEIQKQIGSIIDQALVITQQLFRKQTQGNLGTIETLIQLLFETCGVHKRKRKVKEEEVKSIDTTRTYLKKKVSKTQEEIQASKKGTGFSSEVGQLYDLNFVQEKKNQRNRKINRLFELLTVQIAHADQSLYDEVKTIILESSILPVLEMAYRSATALEMTNDFELYTQYLNFTEMLALRNDFIDLFKDLDPIYEPRQTESIFKMIHTIAHEQSKIYLDCLDNSEENSESKIKPLYQKFINVCDILNKKIQSQTGQEKLEILGLSVEEAYRIICSPFRFKKFDMKKSAGVYDHHYSEEVKNNGKPPQQKMIRVAQEITTLSKNLPINSTDSAFVIIDHTRSDLMKFMIMGAQGTPYAHGGFVFDLYFTNDYPNKPPKVNLATTGGGKIRFNPNLYANGKVCLSLLGTWQVQSTATENWQPNISTVYQVILSIGCTLMVDDIYFNEPGEETKKGTPEGIKQNNAYCNIVRYGTAKYAILEHLKNPPAGFEQAIYSSFFVKKDVILCEIQSWIDASDTLECSYTGFTDQHNHELASKFAKEPGAFKQNLTDVYQEIKEEFKKLQNPNWTGQVKSKQEPTLSRDKSRVDLLQEIDVTYDAEKDVSEFININDDKVKDRWSRYIGAMGIEAVAKQAESTVLVVGVGAVGIEICKNIVLAGCKELIIADQCQPIWEDLCGQFFFSEAEVFDSKLSHKTRADYSKHKLQQLNSYVKVTNLKFTTMQDIVNEVKNKQVKVLVIADCQRQGVSNLDLAFLNNQIRDYCQMIVADQIGLFCRVITDFNRHVVIDKTGKQIEEILVDSIESDTKGRTVIKTLSKHDFQDGDIVHISQVVGIEGLNDQKFEVACVLTQSTFLINVDISTMTGRFSHNGVIKIVNQPLGFQFDAIDKVIECYGQKYYDENFWQTDLDRMARQRCTSVLFKTMQANITNYQVLEELVLSRCESDDRDLMKKFSLIFWETKQCCFGPLSAFLGGIVSQEIVKAITQKFVPIKQEMYLDATELYQAPSTTPNDDRLKSLFTCLGSQNTEYITKAKIFMVGAGAIGCELLKNFAMLSLGSKGQITLTDPDVIEVSNLTRQFLFREKHLRKPKSGTAAAAVIQMNESLRGHINARLDKLHDETASTYSEAFFASQDIVANALDNVSARKFVDLKCLESRTILVDSGTQGTLGHVQVIVPYKTETYGSSEDPDDDKSIPVCTLKMFPEETMHCVEWAKDIFAKKFTVDPKTFNKYKDMNCEDIEFIKEEKQIGRIAKLAKNAPVGFDDCIRLARKIFQKKFHDEIIALLMVYPLDKLKDDGKPFWCHPKRPPTPQIFNPSNEFHSQFIAALACLLARSHNIPVPANARDVSVKNKFAVFASKIEVKPYSPNKDRLKSIQDQVNKEQSNEISESIDTTAKTAFNAQKWFLDFVTNKNLMQVQEFEKDDDKNFHVDFIHSCANVRSLNYGLQPMDWITVKIKAGRIIPALATTTSVIAGLQTLELVKLLIAKKSGFKVDLADTILRNAYVNLSVPTLQLSEPFAPQVKKVTASISVTVWDRWEFTLSSSDNLGSLLADLEAKFDLEARDVIMDAQIIYSYLERDTSRGRLQQLEFTQPLKKLLRDRASLEDAATVDLMIAFVDPKGSQDSILENIPKVRITFKDNAI